MNTFNKRLKLILKEKYDLKEIEINEWLENIDNYYHDKAIYLQEILDKIK